VIGKSELESWLGGPSSKTDKRGSRVKTSDVVEAA
jgi:hypothetical protein